MTARQKDTSNADPVAATGLRGTARRDYVRALFDGIAPHYDRMNLIISLGQTSWWRFRALGGLHLAPGGRALDVGCGTGVVVRQLQGRHPGAEVDGLDLSSGMLAEARRQAVGSGQFIEADVTHMPLPSAYYGLVTTVYTLRNFPDLPAALDELVRVLQPGGRLMILDAFPPQGSGPLGRGWAALQRFWLVSVMPRLVALFGADPDPYRYLAASILRHISIDRLIDELRARGLVVERVRRFGFGAAAALVARRGDAPAAAG